MTRTRTINVELKVQPPPPPGACPGCGTPQVLVTSPMEGDREFMAHETFPLAAEVIDPSTPPDASDTPGAALPVRWSVTNVDGDGTEMAIGTGNPLAWRPATTLPPGCKAGLYTLIARASNAAGETTAFRVVSIGDLGRNCD